MSEFKQIGTVEEVGETVCLIRGLPHATMEEEVIFESGTHGLVLRLDEDYIHAVILGNAQAVKRGDKVESTGQPLSAPVGQALLGRVVNPLGVPVDGKGTLEYEEKRPIESPAPTIFQRKAVKVQLETGIMQIDGMLPVGRGQRATIIGDAKSGKTAALATAMINLARVGVISVYVAIGKPQAQIKTLANKFTEEGVMDKIVIVMATAAMSPTMNYIAPYTGCTIGEYFMNKGQHVLMIYDDLSQHAKAYRQMALLLKRPPGREAYPGDIFYIHSRLLERAAQLSDEYGGGSMAALPVIEAAERDLSGYVATNVLSITDGHILFDMSLFNKGLMPAIAIELSVSRLGGKVQGDVLKKLGVKVQRILMQYREAQAFASFGTDLADETKNRIARGERAYELLKQKIYEAIKLSDQIMMFYGITEGLFDKLQMDKVGEAKTAFCDFLHRDQYKQLGIDIMDKKLDIVKPAIEQFLADVAPIIEPFNVHLEVPKTEDELAAEAAAEAAKNAPPPKKGMFGGGKKDNKKTDKKDEKKNKAKEDKKNTETKVVEPQPVPSADAAVPAPAATSLEVKT